MSIENIYTSVACNQKTGSADWGQNKFILYAACNAVALLNPHYDKSSKIIKTYVGHSKRVNTVKWILNCNQFLSAGDDCVCIHWILDEQFEILNKFIIKGHTESVTALDSIYLNDCLTIVTVGSDSAIKLWQRQQRAANTDEYECVQTISLNGGLCLAIRTYNIESHNECALIAFATDDHKVHLYGRNANQFVNVETLIGHEDWVRALDFARTDNGDILLASASQDTFIRLWRLSPARTIDSTIDDEIRVEERQFDVELNDGTMCKYKVALESVLSGHDGWITGIDWHQQLDGTLVLLSSSMDKTLIIWELTEDGVWSEKIRVGDVGGNSLGFLGTKFSVDGLSIFGHGFHGGLYMWHQSPTDCKLWTPGVIVGGHSADARDLAWDPSGTLLYTVSVDQTTRVHTEWRRESNESTRTVWHELARPQVHGYDMQAIAMLGRYSFASAADEKIVRIFHAPGNFVKNLRRICSISYSDDVEGNNILNSNSKGASVPSLGLSNKEIYDDPEPNVHAHVKDEYSDQLFVPVILDEPPTETTLIQSTLWPESQKLYGHGYDIYALCSTSDGHYLASSCKATTAEHAQIILWNAKTWKQIQKLASHQLTITQMKFSPNDRYLLSVGRDRKWSVFEKTADEATVQFTLIACTDKTNGVHTRIIWTCDWTHNSAIFATGSRDGKLVAWHRSKNEIDSNSSLGCYKSISTFEMKNESITAVAFAKQGEYFAAIGLELGRIEIFTLLCDSGWSRLFTIDQSSAHHLTVKKLAFRPNIKRHQLASCGEDNFVRIYELDI